MDIHIRTGALSHAFSLTVFSFFFLFSVLLCECVLYLSFGYLYCIVVRCVCFARNVCCVLQSSHRLSLFNVCKNPFFVERYDTLLMLHFRFATTMTASIWLCLATTRTQFNPSHFHHIFCCSMRVFHCRPRIFCIFRIFGYHRHTNTQRENRKKRKKEMNWRVAVLCNLSLAYFLSFQ